LQSICNDFPHLEYGPSVYLAKGILTAQNTSGQQKKFQFSLNAICFTLQFEDEFTELYRDWPLI